MRERLLAWLRWEPVGLGPYETIRARLMARCTTVIVVATALTVPFQLLTGPLWLALVPAVYAVMYGVALAILRSGRQQTAATIVVGGSTLSLAVTIVPLGGVHGTGLAFVALLVLVAVLWLDWRGAIVAVALALGLVAATPALEGLGLSLPPFFAEPDRAFALTVSHAMAMALAAVLAGTTSDALHATSQEAEAREDQAARAAAVAKVASESKSSFLATMSHELRTPLNAILGYAELLREDAGPDAADLERIEAAGRHLLALVDDVLEMARADSTPRPARAEDVDLLEVVREQVARLPAARVLVRGGPSVARTDRTHVRRIVATLLARAAALGPVDVDVEAGALVVRDAGPELDADTLARLFEPFARVPGADPTGLGLAVSRRLAERIGATLEAAPSGGGTAFSLRLRDLA
jgi:signal transduction histidine kinase